MFCSQVNIVRSMCRPSSRSLAVRASSWYHEGTERKVNMSDYTEWPRKNVTPVICNSRYHKYAIWPRDGACHANHAFAALSVSRSCRQAFVFFHWKCTQVLQKSLSLSIKQTCFNRYHHYLLRHLVAFLKFEWFVSSDPKIKNFSTHFVHKT